MKLEISMLKRLMYELRANKVFFEDTVCEGTDYVALMLNGQIVGAEVLNIIEDGIECVVHYGAGFKAYLHKPDFAVMNKQFAEIIIKSKETRDLQEKQIN